MASLIVSYTFPLPRLHTNLPIFFAPSFVRLHELKLRKTCWSLRAVSKKKTAENELEEVDVEKPIKTAKRTPRRTKKTTIVESTDELLASAGGNDALDEEKDAVIQSSEDSKKAPKRTRRKATALSPSSVGESSEKKVSRRRSKKKIDNMEDEISDAESSDLEEPVKKVTRRRSKKKIVSMEDEVSDAENSDHEEPPKVTRKKSQKKIDPTDDQESDVELNDSEDFTFIVDIDEEEDDLEFPQGGDDDISVTYSWPPLVCCFGAAQHAFVPSGRPANRLIDYKIHERMKDALWAPEKFVRAPGSSSGSVALALASLGGRVEFMGKLGDDDYGKTMLYYLNMNNVQTRSVSIDTKRLTAISQMKMSRRGRLRMTCIKPCAEDSLSRSEINIDVLKEAKMFYFNTSSLLDKEMRATTLRAIKLSRKLGSVVFFDLNLPLPLWKSNEETKMFIQQVWNLSDIIEVTKQELEFLCGIESSERFDTKDNDKSKFIHYKPEVVMPLWHENLKVLFVTNGTSKIHYYTEKCDGSVHGMEDPPLTPFTCDMSASGDGVVAGLLRMLTVQPHLITDKGYLDRTIKYAIDCGVIDQWLLGRTRGFPPKEDMEEEFFEDENGIKSITEMQYRTLEPAS